MLELYMDRKTISISTADDAFEASLTAVDSVNRPGLMLLPEVLGPKSHAQELADLYAEEGYLVLLPDLVRRTGGSADPTLGRNMQQDIDRTITKAAAAANMLRANSLCNGKVAAIGWSFGATVACSAANRLVLDAVVAYRPLALDHHLDALKSIKCPVGFH
jgi:carboxymethylenebutenolidase